MRALFIFPSTALGGAEATLRRIALELKQRGWSVCLVFLSGRYNESLGEFEQDELFITECNSEKSGLVKVLRNKFFSLGDVDFDYSFTSHTHTNAFVSVLKRLRILKIEQSVCRESMKIFSCFSGLKLLTFKFLYTLYDPKAILVCQTNQMKEELLCNVSRLKNCDVRVVCNSVNYYKVTEKSKQQPSVTIENLEEGIVVVGRLVWEKGHTTLLKSYKMLIDNKDFHGDLILIGDGGLREDLKDEARNLGLSSRVKFLGNLDNPYPFMKLANLVVLSSHSEGFPNVLLEYMVAANAVVATACADGVEELPGIKVCKPNDIDGLYQSMSSSLELDEEKRNFNVEIMRSYVKRLDVSSFVDKIMSK